MRCWELQPRMQGVQNSGVRGADVGMPETSHPREIDSACHKAASGPPSHLYLLAQHFQALAPGAPSRLILKGAGLDVQYRGLGVRVYTSKVVPTSSAEACMTARPAGHRHLRAQRAQPGGLKGQETRRDSLILEVYRRRTTCEPGSQVCLEVTPSV